MPREDRICIALFDTLHHFVENRTTWNFSRVFFNKFKGDIQILSRGIVSQFSELCLNTQNLLILDISGLTSIQKEFFIFHIIYHSNKNTFCISGKANAVKIASDFEPPPWRKISARQRAKNSEFVGEIRRESLGRASRVPHFGFQKTDEFPNGAGIVPDENIAPLIKKTFEAYSTGNFTLRELRDKFNELGLCRKNGKQLAVSNYQQILKNPIFTGLMRYGGEIYEGKHEPIISKKLFDSVQEVMMRKSKPHSKGLKPFLYRGFFRCGECGCFITTETQKGHNYLRCTKRKNPCEQKYVREEIITSQIKEEIKKVSLPLDWVNWMIEENRKDQSSEIQSSEIFSQKTKDEISLLDSKIEKLMTAYLE